MLVAMLACTGDKDAEDTGPEDFSGTFTLTDARNYTFSSSLDIGCQEVALAEDFSIDWSGLTQTMLGEPVALADIVAGTIVAFDTTQEEIAEKLTLDDIDGDDIAAFAGYQGDGTTTEALASEFVIPPSVPFDPAQYFTNADYAWLVAVGGGINDYAMVTFLCPVAGSTSHAITLTDDSTGLDFEAELEALDAFDIAVPDAWVVEWSGLTKHANGTALDFTDIDQLMLARYEMPLADIEADFIALETLAAETYQITPSDTSDGIYGLTEVDLATAVDANGAAFSGFEAGSTWLLALRCTDCANPAPPFLTVIEVE